MIKLRIIQRNLGRLFACLIFSFPRYMFQLACICTISWINLKIAKTTLAFRLHNAMLVTFNEGYSSYVFSLQWKWNLRTFVVVEKYHKMFKRETSITLCVNFKIVKIHLIKDQQIILNKQQVYDVSYIWIISLNLFLLLNIMR